MEETGVLKEQENMDVAWSLYTVMLVFKDHIIPRVMIQ